MSHPPKPPPEDRTWFPIYWALRPEAQAMVRELLGAEWRPPESAPATRAQKLEGLRELARIMRQRPGIVGQLRPELLERIEGEGE